ncbi:hypothetical protein I3843_02G071800 [Carya illinoinensis]|nr:hypothetical protein I3843_02G071800 [Carya illinoinensis]
MCNPLCTIVLLLPSFCTQTGFLQCPSLSLKYISSTFDQQPFVVSYLINTLGLSLEVVVSASKYVSFETPKKAKSILNLVRRLHTVLLSDPNKTILPKIEFFASKGISSCDLAKMLSGCPDILKRSIGKQIILSFDFFKYFLQYEDKIVQAIKRFLVMLLFDLETYMVPNINTLRENRFREIMEEIKEMGFNPLRLKFAIAVVAFRAMSKSTWESKDEVFVAFKRHPWCMMASKDKIMGVMGFFVNKMSLKPSVVFKRQSLVSLSLKKRLIPRGFGYSSFSKGLVKKDIGISLLFRCLDEMFLRKFVMPHKEEASKLLKLYRECHNSTYQQ